MPIFRGDQATVGWAKETTLASANNTTSGSFGIMEAFNAPDPVIDWKVHRWVGGGRDVLVQAEGKNTLEAGFSMIPQDLELLEFAFGQKITSGTTYAYFLGSGKTYVYSGTYSGAIPSFTIETTYTPGQTSFPRQFAGCKVDKLTLTQEEEGELKMDIDIKAVRQQIANDASPTPAVYTNSPFLFHGGSLSLFGTAFGKVTNFELSMANNLKSKFYITSGQVAPAKFAGDILEGVRDYELTVGTVVQDSTVWSRLTSATISGFTTVMTLVEPNTSHSVDIVAQYCNITQTPHNIPEDKAEVVTEIKMRPRVVTVYEHYPHAHGY